MFTELEGESVADVTKKNLARIRGSFATLVTNITANLTAKRIDIREFRRYIRLLFPPGHFVSRAQSVTEACEAVTQNKLWDFLSFTPLEEIVSKFGERDPNLTRWIDNYKSELAGFLSVTKISDYIKAADQKCSNKQDIACYDQEYFHTLSSKLKARVNEQSLTYIDKLWRSITTHFFLPSLPVLLDSVKEGCVEVTWLVPTALAVQIEANIQDTIKFWEKMEVTHLVLDGKVLYTSGPSETVSVLITDSHTLIVGDDLCCTCPV